MAKGKKREVKIVIAAKDRYSKPLTAAGRKFKAFGMAMGKYIKAGAMIATAALAGLTAAMYKSVLMAGSFGKRMGEISTLSPEVARNIDAYANAVIRLSGQTGQPLEILQKGLYDTISAGIAAGDSIKFLDTAARLAVGGVAETSQAVDVLTSILNAYKLKATEAEAISDQLFTTVKLGKTTIAELSTTVGAVAPLMVASGASTREMFAAVAELTLALPSTAEAVVGLKGVMTAFNKPTKEMTAALKGYRSAQYQSGFETAQQAIKAIGLAGALQILNDASEGSVSKMLKFIPRVQGANAALILAQGGAAGFIEKLDEMKNSTGAADEAYKKMSNTWDFRINRMGANAKTFAVSVGELITKNKFFNTVVDAGSSLFEKWTWYIRNNKRALMEMAKGGLLWVIEGVETLLQYMQPLHNAWLGLKLVGTTSLAVIVNAISKTYDALLIFLSPLKKVFDGFVQLGLIKVNPFTFIGEALSTFAESSAAVASGVVDDIIEINNWYIKAGGTVDDLTAKLQGFVATEFGVMQGAQQPVVPVNPSAKQFQLQPTGEQQDIDEGALALTAEQLQNRLDIITASQQTEREQLLFDREAKRQIIFASFEQGLIAEGTQKTMIENLEAQHQAKVSAITVKGLTDRQKFQKLGYREQAKTIFGELANITQGVAQNNRQLFEINKVAGIANAIINAYEGMSRTWKAYPYPLNVGMMAVQAVTAFAQVNAIRSTSFSGGGAAPSVAGTGGGLPAEKQAPSSALLLGAESRRTAQEINIYVQNPITGEIGQDAAEAIVKAVTEAGDERDIKINYMAA